MTTNKTIEQKFRKLTDIEHVLLRPARYIGVTKPTEATTWLLDESIKKMRRQTVLFNPGFLKMFDEIITNSTDFSKTPEGKHVDSIRVRIDRETGEISVYDNGGIPVVMHQEHNMWLPVMLFKELKAGSNFNDDDGEVNEGAGQNGEGAGLTNIFSDYFIVETCDTKNRLKVKFYENNHKQTEPAITPMDKGTKGYTMITWLPDYKRLEMPPQVVDGKSLAIDDANYAVLVKRIIDISAVNTHLKVYLNGDRIQIRSFKDYVQMFVTKDPDTTDEKGKVIEGKEQYIYDEGDKWCVGLAHSDEGFQQTSFVNSTHVKGGGNHVEHIMSQICDGPYGLRVKIKKKYKVDVKPTEIRQYMHLFINCSIDKPRYSEQTKDNMVSSVTTKNGFAITESFINKIMTSNIISKIIEWAELKEEAARRAAMREAAKGLDKANPNDIEKLKDATEKKDRTKCILFLAEGDSAGDSIPRDVLTQGVYPLRGKPLNVCGLDELKLLANSEFANIMTIMGLQYGVEVKSPKDLRYGRGIGIMSDQDLDGFHIQGLLLNMLYRCWPELFKMGLIYRFRTPLLKVFRKKETINFYDEDVYKEWEAKHGAEQPFKRKYYKGLGTSTVEEFEEYLNDLDKHLVPLTYEDETDFDALDLAFNHARADDRKVWLSLRDGE